MRGDALSTAKTCGPDRASRLDAIVLSPRIVRVAAGDAALGALIAQMVRISIDGLPLMFSLEGRAFAHSRRLSADGQTQRVGTSLRYGAIVLIGIHGLDEGAQRAALGGEDAREFCARLASEARESSNLGDVALVAWAAAELAHERLPDVLARLSDLAERDVRRFTVEWAWLVSALAASERIPAISGLAARGVDQLLAAFSHEAGVFPHRLRPDGRDWRDHVACFADQVYPIQALARHHAAFGSPAALAIANRCAEQICRVQGPAGQWWWHYDARTGAVTEGYPVYSVHQDAMGPMALLDLQEAGGDDHMDAVRLSLRWMALAPEVGRSLIDEERLLIWRKVGRSDPRKLVRGMRIAASRLHPRLRLGLLGGVFPARRIDFECRPYHLGWVLHTWLNPGPHTERRDE